MQYPRDIILCFVGIAERFLHHYIFIEAEQALAHAVAEKTPARIHIGNGIHRIGIIVAGKNSDARRRLKLQNHFRRTKLNQTYCRKPPLQAAREAASTAVRKTAVNFFAFFIIIEFSFPVSNFYHKALLQSRNTEYSAEPPRSFIRGSSTSRRLSPSRLKMTTRHENCQAGENHQPRRRRNIGRPSFSI